MAPDAPIDPQVSHLLKKTGDLIQSMIPPGWVFTLLLTPGGEGNGEQQLTYLCNGNRGDMLSVMREFLASQDVPPSLTTPQLQVLDEIQRCIGRLQKNGMFRVDSVMLEGCCVRMDAYGGGFVKQLSNLYRHADGDNQMRMLSTWSKYFVKYASSPDAA